MNILNEITFEVSKVLKKYSIVELEEDYQHHLLQIQLEITLIGFGKTLRVY